MNYLFLITGIFIGLIIGFLIGMFTLLWGIDEGGIKDFYHIPFQLCDRDLYAIKGGKLERIMTIPTVEEIEKQEGNNDCIYEN